MPEQPQQAIDFSKIDWAAILKVVVAILVQVVGSLENASTARSESGKPHP